MKALCDQYGSLIVEEDGDNIFGYAWNSGGVIDDFDNQGSYSTAFALLLETYGYQPVVTRFEANGVTFTHDGESVFIYWDADQHDVVPIVSAWTNGEANMFWRILNDGTADVKVVVDEDGKLCTIDGWYLTINGNDEVVGVNDGTKLTALTTAAGGTTSITMTTAENDMIIYTNDDYSVTINPDGEVKSGAINQWTSPTPIAVEGAIQVFADENCTRYAEEGNDTVYVRLNRSFGFGQGKQWGSQADEKTSLVVVTPSTEDPQNKYQITIYVDYASPEYDSFDQGQVIAITNSTYPIEAGFQVIFRDE